MCHSCTLPATTHLLAALQLPNGWAHLQGSHEHHPTPSCHSYSSYSVGFCSMPYTSHVLLPTKEQTCRALPPKAATALQHCGAVAPRFFRLPALHTPPTFPLPRTFPPCHTGAWTTLPVPSLDLRAPTAPCTACRVTLRLLRRCSAATHYQ